MAHLALAWVPRDPVVDVPIAGVTKECHLGDAVAATRPEFADDEAVTASEAAYRMRA